MSTRGASPSFSTNSANEVRPGASPKTNTLLDLGALLAFLGFFQKGGHGEEILGLGGVQLEGQFINGIERVNRGGGPAQQRHGQEDNRIFQQIRAVERHHVAFAEAALSQILPRSAARRRQPAHRCRRGQ